MGEMEKAWKPQEVERELYQGWEEAGLFVADPHSPRPHFSMVLPPPNITGELHLGHAVNHSLQDVYARYKRMRGFEVLWLPGTDHAAIATQNVIEKRLAAEGTSKEELGRAAFEKRVAAWYESVGATILDQERRLGLTLDWSRLRFTLDPAYVRAIREAFVRLFNDGLLYRGPRIVNWCPHDRSSISDLEVDWQEQEDKLYYVRYDMIDGDGHLVVATVRPETMLGDTALAVNPKDERYRQYVGRKAWLPIVGRELPVIADEAVEMNFGTGAIKVTPGHDPLDYEIGLRHGLEIITCIDKVGNIISDDWVPDTMRTRDVLTARERMVELLQERDHLVKVEPYVHSVGHCDRCGAVIEPLVDEQWWMSMAELREPAVKVVADGRIRFHPDRWARVYVDWMAGLRDWNISRQLWLGHRIPVYYCAKDHTFASVDEPTSCPDCGDTRLRQDPDVLDTWFSSALWPFATMGWPAETEDLKAFYPTDVLGTDRNIIFLWVARMIMTSLRFMNDIPFKDVLIHATIQARDGQRMSKSKGNGVNPIAMIDRYGADAVRAWAAAVGLRGQDVRFDEELIRSYQLFANKLWNVARLVLANVEGVAIEPVTATAADRDCFDAWILSRLDVTVAEVTDALERFRPGDAITAIYEFAWHEFADWYLEAAKPRFRTPADDPDHVAAASTALHVLDTCLRLLHAFMPFVTEATWQRLPGPRQPLIASTEAAVWPEPAGLADAAGDAAMASLFALVRSLRDARKDIGAGERERVPVAARRLGRDPSSTLLDGDCGRAAIAWLASVDFVETLPVEPARTLVAAGLELRLGSPERSRGPQDDGAIERELETTRANIVRLQSQLDNQQFLRKARPEVVQQARDRLAAAEERLATLEDAFSRA
jgi:valyl-tRNA synthetase